jgi:fido (protein-threonine AMPylation protein)
MPKYVTDLADPYVDPVHQVLHNHLGIKDPTELQSLEATLVVMRTYELILDPVRGRHLKRRVPICALCPN